MTKKPKGNSVGPWAREKLDALGRYLTYYTTVLKNQGHWLEGTIYVDAFAGPGLFQIRKPDDAVKENLLFDDDPDSNTAVAEFLKGSPRVALDIANPFGSYVFIERDLGRISELHTLKAQYSDSRSIDILEGDANKALLQWVNSGINWRKHRAVVFLDPFGPHVLWTTIESLARTKSIEVFINFPLDMAIQRMLPRSGEIPETWRTTLDGLFGSPDWQRLIYEERSDLFGTHRFKVDDSAARLVQWYRDRLKKIFRSCIRSETHRKYAR